jgi:hypothetical protein
MKSLHNNYLLALMGATLQLHKFAFPAAAVAGVWQVYFVSYQGSESSTSEGILRSFEKARGYSSSNRQVISVLLLDEVGLAELSPHNPLKVRQRGKLDFRAQKHKLAQYQLAS